LGPSGATVAPTPLVPCPSVGGFLPVSSSPPAPPVGVSKYFRHCFKNDRNVHKTNKCLQFEFENKIHNFKEVTQFNARCNQKVSGPLPIAFSGYSMLYPLSFAT
jgi:hypothetical protein